MDDRPPRPLPISINATKDVDDVSRRDFRAEHPPMPPPKMHTSTDGADVENAIGRWM